MIILPDDIDTSLRHAVQDDFVIFVSQSKSPLISGDGLYSIRRQGEPLACKKEKPQMQGFAMLIFTI